MNAAELLAGTRVVPVVVIDDPNAAVPLAKTLLDAGLRAIEVTLRTSDAIEAIRNVAAEAPDILIGAGSLRTPDQIEAARAAGAIFGVSPGSSYRLLDAVDEAEFPFIPGAITRLSPWVRRQGWPPSMLAEMLVASLSSTTRP